MSQGWFLNVCVRAESVRMNNPDVLEHTVCMSQQRLCCWELRRREAANDVLYGQGEVCGECAPLPTGDV